MASDDVKELKKVNVNELNLDGNEPAMVQIVNKINEIIRVLNNVKKTKL